MLKYGKVYKKGKLKMELQKITPNLLPNSHSNLNIADITNTNQKTLRSLHNISSSNINSKSKLNPGPQFVISYNFQNDPNSQVRTHNLFIGLDQVTNFHLKKNTFRKNAILRSNQIANSHSNLRNSKNDSLNLRNKLIHVRSNQILSSQHNKPDSIVQSLYKKNEKQKNHPQSFTHANTFWQNQRSSIDEARKTHEKHINSNVTKIAYRRSSNNKNGDANVLSNSIQKISRKKLNRLDQMESKQNHGTKVHQNQVYDIPNSDILERDYQSRLTRNSNKQDEYNEKLETILRKVKRQNTRQNLKQAYIKQQQNLTHQQALKLSKQNSKSHVFPQNKSIHEGSLEKQNNLIEKNKHQSQFQHQLQGQQKKQLPLDFIDPLKNHNALIKVDSVSRSVSNHHKTLIEKQNTQKSKRKYHQLIKNPNKFKKESLLEEFHRIESENQNEFGSSKKQSKQQINDNNLPDKSIDYSINGHFNQNISNIKQTNQNSTPENKEKVTLQKLQFNKSPAQQQKNDNAFNPQKSVQQRYNYHAPTTYERNQNHLSHDRKRLNSSINCQQNTTHNEKEEGTTKRKVPADYKKFLRLLSEENQRKKQFQEMERQRQLSLNAQKTSRFQNLQTQNQHIKRILTPIGNSFMDERRKRLSDERKSKRKQRKQHLKNLNGSIIESDSQSSEEDGKKSYRKKQAKKFKNRSQYSSANSDIESQNSRSNNFRQSLFSSVQKMKKYNEKNSVKASKLGRNQSKYQENKPKAKLNSVQFSNNQNHGNQELGEQSSSKDMVEKQPKEQEKIKNMTGVKIPQKAIETTKSKRNLMRNIGNKNSSNQKVMNTKNASQNQSNSDQKVNQVVNKTQNRFSKNGINSTKDNIQKSQQIPSQQTNQQNQTNPKGVRDSKIKPLDKRVAQQKQRKLKNWNQSEKNQKVKKQQGAHTKKDKIINQKGWKQAQKNKKDKKQKTNAYQNSDQENEQIPNQDPNIIVNKSMKKQANKKKPVRTNENGEILEASNTDKQQNADEEQNSLPDEQDGDQESDAQNKNYEQLKKDENINQDPIEGKANQDIKQSKKPNQVQQSNKKKESLPSIHQNVQISDEKANIKQAQGVQRNSKSSEESNKVSLESKIESGELEKSASLNANHQQASNSHTPQEQASNSNHSQNPSIKVENQNAKNLPNKQSSDSNHSQNPSIKVENQNAKNIPNKQSSNSNHTKALNEQIAQEKKQEIIQNVIQNQDMQQNGFMEISQSKFDIYNHESQKYLPQKSLRQIPQMDPHEFQKRAQIVKFLYSLPSDYQQEINNFIPNQSTKRLINPTSFLESNANVFKSVKIPSLRNALEQLSVFDQLNPKSIEKKAKGKSQQPAKNSFLRKIFEPYQNLNLQVGVWMYCVGVWRLVIVNQGQQQCDQYALLQCLQKAFETALKNYYSNMKIDDIKHQEILRMLTGLRISTLAHSKRKTQKIFRQIEYNKRKNHIIRAISSSQSKFSNQTINFVRKIQTTPTGEKVLQIVSTSMSQIGSKPRYFWIREGKFLQFFTSFTIISRRSTDSYWTNDHIKINNQEKAVYMIDSSQKHTSGSITLYPLDSDFSSNKQKCTIAFYKEVEPQVLKLIGKAIQRLPQSKDSVHTSKLYFEFNIKGTYYVFLQLENGLYNVSIESNISQTKLDFVEFVKKETNKNDQCEYVEIDKIFKKKPNINTFQNSSQFKQLMNFMKKTSPQLYQAK